MTSMYEVKEWSDFLLKQTKQTSVMEEGSSFFLGFLCSRERTVSISKSFRPSLTVCGLKQQPPVNGFEIFKKGIIKM